MSNDDSKLAGPRALRAARCALLLALPLGWAGITVTQTGCGGCEDACSVSVTSTLDCVTPTPTVSMDYRPSCDEEPQIDVVNDCAEAIVIGGSREVRPGGSARINLGDHVVTRGAEEFALETEMDCE